MRASASCKYSATCRGLRQRAGAMVSQGRGVILRSCVRLAASWPPLVAAAAHRGAARMTRTARRPRLALRRRNLRPTAPTPHGRRRGDAVPDQPAARRARPARRCAPTATAPRCLESGRHDGAPELLRRRPAHRATPLSLVAITRYPCTRTRIAVGAEHRLGHGQRHDAGAHRRGMDGLAAAPRSHAQRRISRRGRGCDAGGADRRSTATVTARRT